MMEDVNLAWIVIAIVSTAWGVLLKMYFNLVSNAQKKNDDLHDTMSREIQSLRVEMSDLRVLVEKSLIRVEQHEKVTDVHIRMLNKAIEKL